MKTSILLRNLNMPIIHNIEHILTNRVNNKNSLPTKEL